MARALLSRRPGLVERNVGDDDPAGLVAFVGALGIAGVAGDVKDPVPSRIPGRNRFRRVLAAGRNLFRCNVSAGTDNLDLKRADLSVLLRAQIDLVAGLEVGCPGKLPERDDCLCLVAAETGGDTPRRHRHPTARPLRLRFRLVRSGRLNSGEVQFGHVAMLVLSAGARWSDTVLAWHRALEGAEVSGVR